MDITLPLCSIDEAKINEFVKFHNLKYPNDQINVKRAVARFYLDGLYARKDNYPDLYIE